MDNPGNEVSPKNVKLLAYQKSNGKDMAPLATSEETPPTPPPPLPPPPLSLSPPPRPAETHPQNSSMIPEEESCEQPTLNTKMNDGTALVKDSAR